MGKIEAAVENSLEMEAVGSAPPLDEGRTLLEGIGRPQGEGGTLPS